MRAKLLVATVSAAVAAALVKAQSESCEAQALTFPFDGLPACGPSGPLTFEGCCGNLLPEEGGGSVGSGDDGELSEEEAGLCRTMETTEAFCENPDVPGGCDFTPTEVFTLEFDITFTYPEENVECCLKCKCYGDPLCEAFDGSTDEFIECDGRNETTCQQSRDVCKQQFDHTGRRCDWLKNNPKYPDYVNNLVSGSPCQADYERVGNLEILMYAADGFAVNTIIGERGVIIAAEIFMPGVEEAYKISFASCEEYSPRTSPNPEDAWTLPAGVSELPHNWEVTTPNTVDIVWSVGSVENGVFVDIVCTRAVDAVRGRLDVKNLLETQLNREGEGYCFTGEIDRQDQSGSNVNRPGFHFMCLNMLLPDTVSTCKRLQDGTCTDRDLEENQEAWCEYVELSKTMADGDTRDELVASCKNDLKTGDAQTWITYACMMNTPDDVTPGSPEQMSFVMECVQDVGQNGWEEWLGRYEPRIQYTGEQPPNCGNSLSDYGTVDEETECLGGVMVQVFKDGEWQQVFYIPADKPPCEGVILEADAIQYTDLFRYRVRLIQCGLGAECLANEDGTNCDPIPEVTAQLDFAGVDCGAGNGTCTTCVAQPSGPPPQVCTPQSTEPYTMGRCEQCCETLNFIPGQEEVNCRDLTLSTPYCDTEETPEQCEELRRNRADGELRITVTATDDDFNLECCKSCQLWGDPFGQAFDGTREKLIICDARDDTCFSNKEKCLSFLDHGGNPCTFNDTIAAQIQVRGDIGAFGSPCLPDFELSGEAEVVLYETLDPFRVSFFTGERSILTSMNLTTPLGLYNLDPFLCYDESMDFPGWTVLEGAPFDEAFFSRRFNGGEGGYGAQERAWAITDLETGIFMKITCVFSRAVTSNAVGNYRLNVEQLIDLDLLRAEGNTVSGYCPTADLRQFGGEYTPNADAEQCEEDLASDHLAAKAFWAGSATPQQIELGVMRWCQGANIEISVDQCVAQIYRGPNNKQETANRWLRAVCRALIPARREDQTPAQHEQFCQSLGNTDGYFAVVEEYGSAGTRGAVSSFCANSVNDYGLKEDLDEPCLTGISVQYLSDDNEWVEVFFMPSNLLPCSGELAVPANSNRYFPLFTHPIRFEQCDLDPEECPVFTNAGVNCLSALGFSVDLEFSHNDLGCPDTN